MGLSSSMYTGVSGLKGHGEQLGVISNNISNVSTVGFKGSRMHFEDFMSQDINTSAGVGQVGRGVATGAVMADFQQGALETTSEATDVAIGGEGFFVVSPKGSEEQYYTRAGNFRFDKEGYLVDPKGNVVQGWEVRQDRDTDVAEEDEVQATDSGVQIQGVPKDIELTNFQSPPEATTKVDMMANLDSNSEDRSTNEDDPFFAMFENWDATEDVPLADERYAYQSTIKVYDANGSAYNMTTYFDPVRDEDVVDASGGDSQWEYMVTVDPVNDNRSWDDPDDPKRGVLMTGSLTFNAAGDLTGQSAYTLNDQDALDDAEDLESWTEAEFSNNGYPVVTPNFLDEDDASFPDDDNARNIEINFGLRNKTGAWEGGVDNAADVLNDPDNLPNFEDPERSALSTTQYSSASTTLSQSQDGYTSGFLQNISIDSDGVMTGRYSNGQVLELYALTLADFNNQWGLRREGGNLFTETRNSGPAITGLAGTGSLGTISGNSLEMSNVDLATEFVKMISSEKGFQANSKTITTTDQMLSILIQMKR